MKHKSFSAMTAPLTFQSLQISDFAQGKGGQKSGFGSTPHPVPASSADGHVEHGTSSEPQCTPGRGSNAERVPAMTDNNRRQQRNGRQGATAPTATVTVAPEVVVTAAVHPACMSGLLKPGTKSHDSLPSGSYIKRRPRSVARHLAVGQARHVARYLAPSALARVSSSAQSAQDEKLERATAAQEPSTSLDQDESKKVPATTGTSANSVDPNSTTITAYSSHDSNRSNKNDARVGALSSSCVDVGNSSGEVTRVKTSQQTQSSADETGERDGPPRPKMQALQFRRLSDHSPAPLRVGRRAVRVVGVSTAPGSSIAKSVVTAATAGNHTGKKATVQNTSNWHSSGSNAEMANKSAITPRRHRKKGSQSCDSCVDSSIEAESSVTSSICRPRSSEKRTSHKKSTPVPRTKVKSATSTKTQLSRRGESEREVSRGSASEEADVTVVRKSLLAMLDRQSSHMRENEKVRAKKGECGSVSCSDCSGVGAIRSVSAAETSKRSQKSPTRGQAARAHAAPQRKVSSATLEDSGRGRFTRASATNEPRASLRTLPDTLGLLAIRLGTDAAFSQASTLAKQQQQQQQQHVVQSVLQRYVHLCTRLGEEPHPEWVNALSQNDSHDAVTERAHVAPDADEQKAELRSNGEKDAGTRCSKRDGECAVLSRAQSGACHDQPTVVASAAGSLASVAESKTSESDKKGSLMLSLPPAISKNHNKNAHMDERCGAEGSIVVDTTSGSSSSTRPTSHVTCSNSNNKSAISGGGSAAAGSAAIRALTQVPHPLSAMSSHSLLGSAATKLTIAQTVAAYCDQQLQPYFVKMQLLLRQRQSVRDALQSLLSVRDVLNLSKDEESIVHHHTTSSQATPTESSLMARTATQTTANNATTVTATVVANTNTISTTAMLGEAQQCNLATALTHRLSHLQNNVAQLLLTMAECNRELRKPFGKLCGARVPALNLSILTQFGAAGSAASSLTAAIANSATASCLSPDHLCANSSSTADALCAGASAVSGGGGSGSSGSAMSLSALDTSCVAFGGHAKGAGGGGANCSREGVRGSGSNISSCIHPFTASVYTSSSLEIDSATRGNLTGLGCGVCPAGYLRFVRENESETVTELQQMLATVRHLLVHQLHVMVADETVFTTPLFLPSPGLWTMAEPNAAAAQAQSQKQIHQSHPQQKQRVIPQAMMMMALPNMHDSRAAGVAATGQQQQQQQRRYFSRVTTPRQDVVHCHALAPQHKKNSNGNLSISMDSNKNNDKSHSTHNPKNDTCARSMSCSNASHASRMKSSHVAAPHVSQPTQLQQQKSCVVSLHDRTPRHRVASATRTPRQVCSNSVLGAHKTTLAPASLAPHKEPGGRLAMTMPEMAPMPSPHSAAGRGTEKVSKSSTSSSPNVAQKAARTATSVAAADRTRVGTFFVVRQVTVHDGVPCAERDRSQCISPATSTALPSPSSLSQILPSTIGSNQDMASGAPAAPQRNGEAVPAGDGKLVSHEPSRAVIVLMCGTCRGDTISSQRIATPPRMSNNTVDEIGDDELTRHSLCTVNSCGSTCEVEQTQVQNSDNNSSQAHGHYSCSHNTHASTLSNSNSHVITPLTHSMEHSHPHGRSEAIEHVHMPPHHLCPSAASRASLMDKTATTKRFRPSRNEDSGQSSTEAAGSHSTSNALMVDKRRSRSSSLGASRRLAGHRSSVSCHSRAAMMVAASTPGATSATSASAARTVGGGGKVSNNAMHAYATHSAPHSQTSLFTHPCLPLGAAQPAPPLTAAASVLAAEENVASTAQTPREGNEHERNRALEAHKKTSHVDYSHHSRDYTTNGDNSNHNCSMSAMTSVDWTTRQMSGSAGGLSSSVSHNHRSSGGVGEAATSALHDFIEAMAVWEAMCVCGVSPSAERPAVFTAATSTPAEHQDEILGAVPFTTDTSTTEQVGAAAGMLPKITSPLSRSLDDVWDVRATADDAVKQQVQHDSGSPSTGNAAVLSAVRAQPGTTVLYEVDDTTTNTAIRTASAAAVAPAEDAVKQAVATEHLMHAPDHSDALSISHGTLHHTYDANDTTSPQQVWKHSASSGDKVCTDEAAAAHEKRDGGSSDSSNDKSSDCTWSTEKGVRSVQSFAHMTTHPTRGTEGRSKNAVDARETACPTLDSLDLSVPRTASAGTLSTLGRTTHTLVRHNIIGVFATTENSDTNTGTITPATAAEAIAYASTFDKTSSEASRRPHRTSTEVTESTSTDSIGAGMALPTTTTTTTAALSLIAIAAKDVQQHAALVIQCGWRCCCARARRRRRAAAFAAQERVEAARQRRLVARDCIARFLDVVVQRHRRRRQRQRRPLPTSVLESRRNVSASPGAAHLGDGGGNESTVAHAHEQANDHESNNSNVTTKNTANTLDVSMHSHDTDTRATIDDNDMRREQLLEELRTTPLPLRERGISTRDIANYNRDAHKFEVIAMHRLLHTTAPLLYLVRVIVDSYPARPPMAYATVSKSYRGNSGSYDVVQSQAATAAAVPDAPERSSVHDDAGTDHKNIIGTNSGNDDNNSYTMKRQSSTTPSDDDDSCCAAVMLRELAARLGQAYAPCLSNRPPGVRYSEATASTAAAAAATEKVRGARRVCQDDVVYLPYRIWCQRESMPSLRDAIHAHDSTSMEKNGHVDGAMVSMLTGAALRSPHLLPLSLRVASYAVADELRSAALVRKAFPRPFEQWGNALHITRRVFCAAAIYAWKLIFSHTPHDDYKQRQLHTHESRLARLERVNQRNRMILACYGVHSEREWMREACRDLSFTGQLVDPRLAANSDDPDLNKYSRETRDFVEDFLFQCFPTISSLDDVPSFLVGAGVHFLIKEVLQHAYPLNDCAAFAQQYPHLIVRTQSLGGSTATGSHRPSTKMERIATHGLRSRNSSSSAQHEVSDEAGSQNVQPCNRRFTGFQQHVLRRYHMITALCGLVEWSDKDACSETSRSRDRSRGDASVKSTSQSSPREGSATNAAVPKKENSLWTRGNLSESELSARRRACDDERAAVLRERWPWAVTNGVALVRVPREVLCRRTTPNSRSAQERLREARFIREREECVLRALAQWLDTAKAPTAAMTSGETEAVELAGGGTTPVAQSPALCDEDELCVVFQRGFLEVLSERLTLRLFGLRIDLAVCEDLDYVQ